MSNQPSSGDARRIKVTSWNVHHGRGADDRYDLKRTAREIGRFDPDVVGLQEVDRHFRPRSDFDDEVETLAEHLDMQYRFGANVVLEPTEESGGELRRYGIATLCKREYPIDDSQHYLLPKIGYEERNSEQRGLLATTIDIGGRAFSFYNTHLALTEDQRARQAKALLDLTDRRPGPRVLVGDFNATPDSRPIGIVSEQFDDAVAVSARGDSAPADEPAGRIDYVFVTPDVTVVDATVVETAASDHPRIESSLQLPASDH